jgi:hypothetical protein
LVLSHVSRGGQINDLMWREAVGTTFAGEVMLGKDLRVV